MEISSRSSTKPINISSKFYELKGLLGKSKISKCEEEKFDYQADFIGFDCSNQHTRILGNGPVSKTKIHSSRSP